MTFSLFWPDGDGTNCRINNGVSCVANFSINDPNKKYSVAPAGIQKGSSGDFCVNVGDSNLNSPPGDLSLLQQLRWVQFYLVL